MAPAAADPFPAGQSMQLAEPFEEAYRPCVQLLHKPIPRLEKLPGAQVPVTPVDEHADPAGQRVHELDDEEPANCPAEHTLQTPAPLDE